MSTAFDKIWADRQLQDHWIRRLIAAIIDGILTAIATAIIIFIVTIPFLVLGARLAWFFNSLVFPFFIGIIWIFYAAFMESSLGATIGKQIMNLKVTMVDGKIVGLDIALIRNVSKIYWILWLVDTILGMAMPGDAHQKYTDRIVGTTVVSTTATTMFISMPPVPPAPQPPPA